MARLLEKMEVVRPHCFLVLRQSVDAVRRTAALRGIVQRLSVADQAAGCLCHRWNSRTACDVLEADFAIAVGTDATLWCDFHEEPNGRQSVTITLALHQIGLDGRTRFEPRFLWISPSMLTVRISPQAHLLAD